MFSYYYNTSIHSTNVLSFFVIKYDVICEYCSLSSVRIKNIYKNTAIIVISLLEFCHDTIMFLKLISLLFYSQVYEHKEARSGKSCYVRVTASLQADLVAYRERVRTPLSGGHGYF